MKDMTEGKPFPIILKFALPMLLSVIFQQLYNIVDSIIAGNYIGVDALAAVGASFPITSIFLAVATGSSVGCSVVVSQIFGSKKMGEMKTAVSTAITSLLTLGVILTIAGVFICKPLLRMINTPDNIFSDTALYLDIYIYGIIFMFIYNTATAIFNALGNSKKPLVFLIFSSILNVVLDLVFVTQFNMGVAGVAWATFLAQGLSSVLAITTLLFDIKKMNITEPYRHFDVTMLKNISKIAIPSILQQSFISVGQLFVQSLINGLGSVSVAAFTAAVKINTFTISTITAMSNALSSFVAQNYGAKKLDRIYKGFRAATYITAVFAAISVSIIFIFGDKLIGIFMETSSNLEVIAAGKQFLWTVSPFYFAVGLKILFDGILKGTGEMKAFMAGTFTDLLLRVIFSYVAVLGLNMGFAGICWAYPFGWVAATLICFYYFKKANFAKTILT